jgi:hypothetical protein
VNTLVAVAIAPFGIGDELGAEVAEVIKLSVNRVYRIVLPLCLLRLKANGTK